MNIIMEVGYHSGMKQVYRNGFIGKIIDRLFPIYVVDDGDPGNYFFAIYENGEIIYSQDSINWTDRNDIGHKE